MFRRILLVTVLVAAILFDIVFLGFCITSFTLTSQEILLRYGVFFFGGAFTLIPLTIILCENEFVSGGWKASRARARINWAMCYKAVEVWKSEREVFEDYLRELAATKHANSGVSSLQSKKLAAESHKQFLQLFEDGKLTGLLDHKAKHAQFFPKSERQSKVMGQPHAYYQQESGLLDLSRDRDDTSLVEDPDCLVSNSMGPNRSSESAVRHATK